MKTYIYTFLAVIMLMTFSNSALAATAAEQSESLLDLVAKTSAGWHDPLEKAALYVFWSLALIQLILTFMPLLFKQADFGEIVGEMIKYTLITGFFYALLVHSTEWSVLIVNSFKDAASSATDLPTDFSPGSVFTSGIMIAEKVGRAAKSLSWLNAADAILLLIISSLIITICFAYISAFMFKTLAEMYIITNAAVLLMGFGALSHTRDYAINAFRYAVSVGVKLFVMILIIGLIGQVLVEWTAAYTGTVGDTLTLLGCTVICVLISRDIPEVMSGLISGQSMGNGNSIGIMAVAAMAAMAGVVKGLQSLGSALDQASKKFGGEGGGAKDLASSLSSLLSGGAPNTPPGGVDTGSAKTMTGGGSARPTMHGNGSTSGSEPQKSNATSRAKSATKMVTGSLLAMSVPGMESMAGAGGGGEASGGHGPDDNASMSNSDEPIENENVIRPAQSQETPDMSSVNVPGMKREES